MEIIAACNPQQNLAKPSDNDSFDGNIFITENNSYQILIGTSDDAV